MVLSWENTNLNHCKQQQNEVRLTISCYYNQDKFMASAPFWVLFKFVLFDITGLFIRDWELELPSCGRDLGTSSGIISLLEF